MFVQQFFLHKRPGRRKLPHDVGHKSIFCCSMSQHNACAARNDFVEHYVRQVRAWESRPSRAGFFNGRQVPAPRPRGAVRAARHITSNATATGRQIHVARAPYFSESNLWGGDGCAQQRNLYLAWRETLEASELWRRSESSDDLYAEFLSWWIRFEEAYKGRSCAEQQAGSEHSERQRAAGDHTDAAHEELDPYAVLGVAEDATLETIRAAYRLEVKRCHPDALGTGVSGTTDPAALARFIAVQEAWQVLSDSDLRRQYDLSRRLQKKSGYR
jgi:hypothetical protein